MQYLYFLDMTLARTLLSLTDDLVRLRDYPDIRQNPRSGRLELEQMPWLRRLRPMSAALRRHRLQHKRYGPFDM